MVLFHEGAAPFVLLLRKQIPVCVVPLKRIISEIKQGSCLRARAASVQRKLTDAVWSRNTLGFDDISIRTLLELHREVQTSAFIRLHTPTSHCFNTLFMWTLLWYVAYGRPAPSPKAVAGYPITKTAQGIDLASSPALQHQQGPPKQAGSMEAHSWQWCPAKAPVLEIFRVQRSDHSALYEHEYSFVAGWFVFEWASPRINHISLMSDRLCHPHTSSSQQIKMSCIFSGIFSQRKIIIPRGGEKCEDATRRGIYFRWND